jgi:hypothetical protein
MAIANDAMFGLSHFAARIFLWLLGSGAIAWAAFVLPLFWQQATLSRVASELLQGHSFKIQWVLREAQEAEAAQQSSFCDPTILHDAVVLHLAILDDAMSASNKTLVNSAYSPLYDSTRRALSCAPADPFAWLTLFWLDFSKYGFERDNATYLRLSYALGPNEGWIALRRSRLAIALFPRLPADLADDAIDEFIRLVDTGTLYSETAGIFASATPAVQSRLLERIKSAKAVPRQIFARTLYDEGFDVKILGIDGPAQPWR